MASIDHLTNYATTVAMYHGSTIVICHRTVIVEFNTQQIILNSGGWHTHKTKNDMNRASNQFCLGYRVFAKDYDWFVKHKGIIYDFVDGMVLK